jgi:hypothetical protein
MVVRKFTWIGALMAAVGSQADLAAVAESESASPFEADMRKFTRHVRFVP